MKCMKKYVPPNFEVMFCNTIVQIEPKVFKMLTKKLAFGVHNDLASLPPQNYFAKINFTSTSSSFLFCFTDESCKKISR
jgi:hypothetical protein